MKSTWLDDTLQLNLTAFYTPYNDIQITTQEFVLLNGTPINATAVLNAGKQVNQGVELETMWRPMAGLTLVANVGYLDAEFEEFFTVVPDAGARLSPGSERLQRADQLARLDDVRRRHAMSGRWARAI